MTDLFRSAFRSHPAGVTVVTAVGHSGPVGLTASSVASVSVDPPSLSFSLSGSRSAEQLIEAEVVVVHMMAASQVDLAKVFSKPGTERFTADMDWTTLPTGEPLLTGTLWALRCRITHRVPVGTSILLAAEVLEVIGRPGSGEPLVYHDRAFYRLAEEGRAG
ncbi:flavin reductase family protein [Paenarthrobacter ureafaciens]|uniref:flavin reductase family protein n=1 Tax=Paenarthrobacter ureafaciens TaxID=37931 RepID=UPI001FB1AFD1|nr:flavin reductase family protein [Paenarthrobacter ureafaciens]UOD81173.1 flavin reductase family protein [Paenarthrobacter ureafaciens]WNZ03833.1 flavin reductase family protein [Paenarthrobacter ureafaciens]